ncbi:unnamed protein product [Ostreobium quekettii]|uniref:Acyl-CoA-binding domain-containing protein n=1 Tax=Ostreobium quekettii TaxID=121088 RepID=A0A8S1JFP5_9CHLO|nr:unnamed protein product [Ostreobium quekettii]
MHGGLPSPRAGHVAGMLGDHLYIVGGGNNAAGCTDMAYLDCSPLYVAFGDSAQWLQMSWSLVGAIPERSIIASEGMSLISVQEAGVLVSFGGYNGKYSNSVSIFRPGSSSMGNEAGEGRPQEGAQQEAQANGRGEAPQAPQGLEGPQGVENMTEAEMQANLQSAWKESENAAREASAAKEFAATELALMRRQLLSAQTALEEKEKALEEAKTQLQAEQSKTLKLEAEAAELRHKLVAMADLEKELEAYRRAAQESQQKGSGLWGFIAGGTA